MDSKDLKKKLEKSGRAWVVPSKINNTPTKKDGFNKQTVGGCVSVDKRKK